MFALDVETVLFEFETNAPAFAPLLAELPAKRQREALSRKRNNLFFNLSTTKSYVELKTP